MLSSMLPSKKQLPPYVSYRTFWNFLEGLQQSMPARIDRSYWGERLSGSTGTQLVAALHFLDMIDNNGFPTAKLRQVISNKGVQRAEAIKQIVRESYDFLFQDTLDPQSATYSQIEEAFHDNFQMAGDVARKCIKFFIGIASDGGIKISTFVTQKTRPTRPVSIAKKTARKLVDKMERTEIPQNPELVPYGISMDKLLIDKFPGFDPAWPDEVKLKWFAAFDELLKRTGGAAKE
jgi:hypothetical protein